LISSEISKSSSWRIGRSIGRGSEMSGIERRRMSYEGGGWRGREGRIRKRRERRGR
jgi:hypothetical protein